MPIQNPEPDSPVVLSLVLLAVLALIVFAFVLEPVVRSRGDRVVVDTIDLPEPLPDIIAGETDTAANEDDEAEDQPENAPVEGQT